MLAENSKIQPQRDARRDIPLPVTATGLEIWTSRLAGNEAALPNGPHTGNFTI